MLEILTLLLLFFVLFCGFILLPILLMVKAVQLLFEPAINEIAGALEEKREHDWPQAAAAEREKMVRKSCGWRVIGRVVGAGALVAGASVAASPAIGIACCLAGWRLLKPIKDEVRDACSYRSIGTSDEPPYSW